MNNTATGVDPNLSSTLSSTALDDEMLRQLDLLKFKQTAQTVTSQPYINMHQLAEKLNKMEKDLDQVLNLLKLIIGARQLEKNKVKK